MRESTGYQAAIAQGRPETFYDELYEGPVRDPDLGVVIVGTYDLVRRILDTRSGDFSNAMTLAPLYLPEPDVMESLSSVFRPDGPTALALLDGPAHRDRRRRAIAAFGSVPDDDEALVGEALDRLGRRLDEGDGTVHLIDELVSPLVMQSSLQRRTGVPEDLVEEVAALLPGQVEMLWGLPGPNRQRSLAQDLRRIWDISNESIERNQAAMRTGTYEHNIITGYLSTKPELTPDDRADIYLHINAGYPSTVHTLNNVIVRSLHDRERWQRLAEKPDEVPQFVQRMVERYSGTHGWFRMVAAPTGVEIAGESVEPGSRLIVGLTAANQAPDRGEGDPGLTFGYGPHSCLGQDFSVGLVTMVVQGLVERFPTLQLADEPRPWANLGFNGFHDPHIAVSA